MVMKHWNLTYNDPERWAQVYAICGKPLSFWEALKVGGSGSPRGVLAAAPGELGVLLDETSYVKYCNVQRMHEGGLLYCKIRLEVFGLPIRKDAVLRVESSRRNADAFDRQVSIVFRDHQRIDIACSERNVAGWQHFLSEIFRT